LVYGYFADSDFGLRAQVAGFELALIRGTFAYHNQSHNFDYLSEKLSLRAFPWRF
jgi:GT2 family glycosyltransferase